MITRLSGPAVYVLNSAEMPHALGNKEDPKVDLKNLESVVLLTWRAESSYEFTVKAGQALFFPSGFVFSETWSRC